jgi:SpoVK/Ycf46/Vps4 family AAA+-type ATPase
MSDDQPLIEALEKVIELEPENSAIRMRLVELFIKTGNGQEALRHAQHMLNDRPDQPSVLNLASQACDLLDQPARASSYRKMADALAGQLIGEPPSMIERPEPGERPLRRPDRDPWQPESAEPKRRNPEEIPKQENKGEKPPEFDRWRIASSDSRLADVAGLENVKKRLHLSFLGPMQSPELRDAFDQSSQGGLLLYGPPGCGKTFLAKAIAGELGAGFLNVAIGEVMDMWYGNSEKLLHLAFEAARYSRPCVLFFDEIDALARKRAGFTGGAGRSLVNQLLAEMDGVDSRNHGVYLLGATNHPWDLDSAIRRPGRLDRILFVAPPDAAARMQIAKRCLSKVPHREVDLEWVAEHTENFSGADVALLCSSAAELALEESMKASRVCPVENRHVKSAIKEIRPSMKSWFESAKNYALFSNDGGEYNDLLEYLKARRMA